METIIDPVDKALLKAELTPDKKLRNTNKGNNELYVITWKDAPNVLREIGRLRELAFRLEGGSVGLSMDLDEFDTMEENPYKQLVVWDPDAEAILGGYRYIFGNEVKIREDGQPHLTSSHLFRYSERFIRDYLPHVVELGRSFVAPEYQSSKAGAKAIFALDNLWDGLAAIMIDHPNSMYFIGKMTMYPSFDPTARDLIFHYLDKYYRDPDGLVTPYNPIPLEGDPQMMDLILKAGDKEGDFKNLKEAVHRLGTAIPPLYSAYLKLSPSVRIFGMTVNDELANVWETGLMVDFDDMYEDKRSRHVDSYIRYVLEKAKQRWPDLEDGVFETVSRGWKRRREKARQRREKRIASRKK